MNILYNINPDKEIGSRICFVFGAGLVGSSIIYYLHHNGYSYNVFYPFLWDRNEFYIQQFSGIKERFKEILKLIRADEHASIDLTLLWSAGRAGFFSSEKELSAETAAFEQILNFVDQLSIEHRMINLSFHLVSSAGGLFEGQTNVGMTTSPQPLRPYGWSKLKQEKLLAEWSTVAAKYCYRPSSIYGLPYGGQRIGLIPTLLQHGMQRQVVNFFGDMDTIRDYVAVEDVARFISSKILNKAARSDGIFTLASAQPTTLYQLKKIAERCIQRKVYARFNISPNNTANNSFLASALPSDWQAMPVEIGCHKLYHNLLQRN